MTILGTPNAVTLPLNFAQPQALNTPLTNLQPNMLQPIAFQPQAGMGLVADPYGIGVASTGDAVSGAAQATGAKPGLTEAVKAALRELGLFRGAVTSNYGTGVRSSVLAFQKKSGLKATGKPNAKTRKALKAALLKKQAAAAAKQPTFVPTPTLQPDLRVGTPAGVNPYAGQVPGAVTGYPTTAGAAMLPMLGAAGAPLEMTGAGTPSGPQVNATNQSGLAAGAHGATQNVTNRNAFASDAQSNIQQPYGYGNGAIGWNSGMMGSPYGSYSPYSAYSAPGASMVGANYLNNDGGGIGGFFSKLFS